MYIFLEQALSLLEEARAAYSQSEHKKDRRYYVPAVGRRKFARRKDDELRGIYDRYVGHSLYATFLVNGVAMFECFLSDILTYALHEYPKSITLKIHDVAACDTIPVDILLDATDRDSAFAEIIRRRVESVMFSRPQAYIRYISEICGVDFSDEVFACYYEIKATRDLLVHNDSKINAVYLSKAGTKARGQIGDPVPINGFYFRHCVAVLSRISGIVSRDSHKKFPPREAGSS